jgi:type II secretory pathway component PulC
VQPSLPTPEAATPKQAAAPKPAPASAKTKKAYTLNGIFTAASVCYALINNSIVQEGEMIGAAVVVSITTDSVELEENGQPIKLTTKKF